MRRLNALDHSLRILAALLVIAVASACSSNSNGQQSTDATVAASSTSTAAASPRPSAFASRPPLLTPTPTPLAAQRLDQLSLAASDLPSGFTVTASGPGGPELGPDVQSSYQEEFQQLDVTSQQSLQQTIVIITLLGQYKDAASALAGIQAINTQSLNQLLGSVNLTAEIATVPQVGENAQAFHFTGNSNNVQVGGYLLVFHRGPIASLVLTAAVKGSESLDQTVSLAQKQDQKLQAALR